MGFPAPVGPPNGSDRGFGVDLLSNRDQPTIDRANRDDTMGGSRVPGEPESDQPR